MRYVGVLVLFGACSGSPSTPTDANAADATHDAFDACANAAYSGCVFGGLASQPFDGVTLWTATGNLNNGTNNVPLMETLYIDRAGCWLTINSASSAGSYVAGDSGTLAIQDTRASYHASGATPHPYSYDTAICVDDASNAVHFTSHWQRTMPMLGQVIDVILTH